MYRRERFENGTLNPTPDLRWSGATEWSLSGVTLGLRVSDWALLSISRKSSVGPSSRTAIACSSCCRIAAAFGGSPGDYEHERARMVVTQRKIVLWSTLDPRWLASQPGRHESPYLGQHSLVVDLWDMSRDVQEIAFCKGLIPYIPTDQKTDCECKGR
jgi:hypothetical protein